MIRPSILHLILIYYLDFLPDERLPESGCIRPELTVNLLTVKTRAGFTSVQILSVFSIYLVAAGGTTSRTTTSHETESSPKSLAATQV